MPFLKLSDEEDEERRLLLQLVEEEQAQDLFEIEKEKVMSDLGSFRDEMKALIEEAKASGADVEVVIDKAE